VGANQDNQRNRKKFFCKEPKFELKEKGAKRKRGNKKND